MDNTIEINGTVAPGFDAVREEFAVVVAEENGESGAQLAAFVHGRQVVDLWAGPQVTGDTPTGLLSATKGASSLVVALLVQEGWLDLDRTVAEYRPECGGLRRLHGSAQRTGLRLHSAARGLRVQRSAERSSRGCRGPCGHPLSAASPAVGPGRFFRRPADLAQCIGCPGCIRPMEHPLFGA